MNQKEFIGLIVGGSAIGLVFYIAWYIGHIIEQYENIIKDLRNRK